MTVNMSPMADLIKRPAGRERKFWPAQAVWDVATFREVVWARRKCFICQKYGKCTHREPNAFSIREFWATKRSEVA